MILIFAQPRMCLRSAEENTVERLSQSFKDLKCVDILGLGDPKDPSNVLEPEQGSLGPRKGGLPV